MENLSEAEQAEWLRKCEHQRQVARDYPCYSQNQCVMPCYMFHLGPWNCTFTLDRYKKPPKWHAALSLFGVIDEERITDAEGRYLFDNPRMGLLLRENWSKEDYADAKDILLMVFGPLAQHDTIILVEKPSDDPRLAWHADIIAVDS